MEKESEVEGRAGQGEGLWGYGGGNGVGEGKVGRLPPLPHCRHPLFPPFPIPQRDGRDLVAIGTGEGVMAWL